MLLKKIILISSIACGSFLSIAQADSLYNAYQGQYVSVGIGATYANKIYQPGNTRSGFLGGGGNLFLGDQITPYVGPELGFNYFGFRSGGVTILSLNGRFTLPVGSRISLFAKLGLGYTELTMRMNGYSSSNSFVPAFGLGVGYGLTSQWMLSAEGNGVYLPQGMGNGNGVIGGLTLAATRYFAQ